jgi:hypothetical protein
MAVSAETGCQDVWPVIFVVVAAACFLELCKAVGQRGMKGQRIV